LSVFFISALDTILVNLKLIIPVEQLVMATTSSSQVRHKNNQKGFFKEHVAEDKHDPMKLSSKKESKAGAILFILAIMYKHRDNSFGVQ